ncbi:MAG: hypothetical protein M3430_13890 [Acidobacteriota bacterium]|nr:hypothetical protein [Acidobacteriota bacterium]
MSFYSFLLFGVGGLLLFVLVSILETAIRMTTGMVLFDAYIGTGFGFPFRFFGLGFFGGGFFSVAKLLLDWVIWSMMLAVLIFVVRVFW